MNITSPKDISALLKENNLSPLKKFGQNFLCDENIINKIPDATGVGERSNVLEIGTGLGALTSALAKRTKRVVSVEIDKGLLALHNQTLAGFNNLQIIDGDILKLNIKEVGEQYFAGESFFVCGNLPYYITSKILMHVLEADAPVLGMTAMVQKEVASRLSAQPKDSDYGALTASCNYYDIPKLLFLVSHNCFYPAPDVESAIIQFDLTKQTLPVERQLYSKVVRCAFSMRRKTIINNLKQIATVEDINTALTACNILPTLRAQDISPEQFCLLTQKFVDLNVLKQVI